MNLFIILCQRHTFPLALGPGPLSLSLNLNISLVALTVREKGGGKTNLYLSYGKSPCP